jgi:hypothetical protein
MKALQRLVCCALAAVLPSTGWARIGATVDECKKLYGEPNMTVPHGWFTRLYFRHGDMYRMVDFADGKVGRMCTMKIGETALPGRGEKKDRPLTDAEVTELLAENELDGPWRPKKSYTAGCDEWVSEGEGLGARHYKTGTSFFMISVWTKEFHEANLGR